MAQLGQDLSTKEPLGLEQNSQGKNIEEEKRGDIFAA